MLRKALTALFLVSLATTLMWGADVWEDRQYQATVIAPAPLLSLPPYEYPDRNPVKETLSPGTPIKVLRVRYGKDFEALLVEASDGQTGWVVSGAEIKVLRPGQ